jgi:hypothetical protein
VLAHRADVVADAGGHAGLDETAVLWTRFNAASSCFPAEPMVRCARSTSAMSFARCGSALRQTDEHRVLSLMVVRVKVLGHVGHGRERRLAVKRLAVRKPV